MDKAALKVKLNLRLRDTNNFTFTSDEKEEALIEAFNDALVVTSSWDSSLTFYTNTFQYARPATVDVVQDIYIKRSNTNDTEPEKIDSKFWEVVNVTIHFKSGANNIIPDGYTLYLKGKNKYATSDTIAETNVQEYVLNLAQLNCLKMLGTIKALSFLKNDTSMGEIVAVKRELEREVARYRQRLPRTFENA